MAGTLSPQPISTGLQRVAQLAKRAPEMAFTTLSHHITPDLLNAAYQRTRKDGAVGVDGRTAEDYAKDLEGNLRSLLDRAKSGRYRAPPVRRVHIPKGDGRSTRPIGIPTFEDKVLQRAVALVLEAVYEQDFLPCSYAFRPGRGAHDALSALWEGMMTMGGGWVLEVDIRDFFGTLERSHLREFIRRRVRDGVMIRLIGKWLNAGVLEEGSITRPEAGTPQGGVISPLLANIYLHEVLDKWFEETVKPRLRGRAFLVRYADDVAIAFSNEADARRVFEVLPRRFGRYGLALHPEKTRLVEFKPPPQGGRGSFDFLGFTHYWGRSRKGRWVVRQTTASSRLRRALKRVSEWCRHNRHWKVKEQHRALARKLQGHYAYYGITGNWRRLHSFHQAVGRTWKAWLGRRSRKAHRSWDWFVRLTARYPLPPARVVHSRYHRAASP